MTRAKSNANALRDLGGARKLNGKISKQFSSVFLLLFFFMLLLHFEYFNVTLLYVWERKKHHNSLTNDLLLMALPLKRSRGKKVRIISTMSGMFGVLLLIISTVYICLFLGRHTRTTSTIQYLGCLTQTRHNHVYDGHGTLFTLIYLYSDSTPLYPNL